MKTWKLSLGLFPSTNKPFSSKVFWQINMLFHILQYFLLDICYVDTANSVLFSVENNKRIVWLKAKYLLTLLSTLRPLLNNHIFQRKQYSHFIEVSSQVKYRPIWKCDLPQHIFTEIFLKLFVLENKLYIQTVTADKWSMLLLFLNVWKVFKKIYQSNDYLLLTVWIGGL